MKLKIILLTIIIVLSVSAVVTFIFGTYYSYRSPEVSVEVDGMVGFYDLDGDGKKEMLCHSGIYEYTDRDFSREVTYSWLEDAWRVKVGELTNDNLPDLFVINRVIVDLGPTSDVYFHLDTYINKGDLEFELYQEVSTRMDSILEFFDWNYDGYEDIFFEQGDYWELGYVNRILLLNDGYGNFNTSVDLQQYNILGWNEYLNRSMLMSINNITLVEKGTMDISSGEVLEMDREMDDQFSIDRAPTIHFFDFDGDDLMDFQFEAFRMINKIFLYKETMFEVWDGGRVAEYNRDRFDGMLYGGIFVDLNDDGLLDLLSKHEASKVHSHDDSFHFAYNQGNLNFSYPIEYSVGGMPELDFADVNGDGDTDIISSNYGSEDVSILLNQGNGNYTRKDYPVKGFRMFDTFVSPTEPLLADLDNDGDIDICTVNYNGGSVTVLKNDGKGDFSDWKEYKLGGSLTTLAEFEDINDDHYIDIVTVVYWTTPDGTRGSLNILFNDGNGDFGESGEMRSLISYGICCGSTIFLPVPLIFLIISITCSIKRNIGKGNGKVEDEQDNG